MLTSFPFSVGEGPESRMRRRRTESTKQIQDQRCCRLCPSRDLYHLADILKA